MQIELFTFDINKKELMVNSVELLAISCFNKLLNDCDSKILSINQIFGYIYWHGSLLSPGVLKGLIGKDLSDNAKVMLDIPSTWIASPLVEECINVYKSMRSTIVNTTLENILISLNTINETVGLTTKSLQQLTLTLKEQTVVDVSQISKIIAANKNINDIIKELPNSIKTVEELLETVKSNGQSISFKGRGNQEITSSMLPD